MNSTTLQRAATTKQCLICKRVRSLSEFRRSMQMPSNNCRDCATRHARVLGHPTREQALGVCARKGCGKEFIHLRHQRYCCKACCESDYREMQRKVKEGAGRRVAERAKALLEHPEEHEATAPQSQDNNQPDDSLALAGLTDQKCFRRQCSNLTARSKQGRPLKYCSRYCRDRATKDFHDERSRAVLQEIAYDQRGRIKRLVAEEERDKHSRELIKRLRNRRAFAEAQQLTNLIESMEKSDDRGGQRSDT